MKPIGQTFYVNEPATGAAGVYITRVDLYFATISDTHGITVEIRNTDNGAPTSNRVAFGRRVIEVDDTHANGDPIIVASADASLPTIVEFDTPVYVPARQSYGLVTAPNGGVPDYEIWTAEIGQTDVLKNVPIYTNHSSGDLFLSSNDRAWTPIIYEDIKYKIYIANFTETTGTVYFKQNAEDFIEYKNATGTFQWREKIRFVKSPQVRTVLNVTGVSGSFNSGDTVYQANASSNVAGVVYSANSTVIKLVGANGAFTNTDITDANTSSTATVTTVNQTVSTTASSNTVSVPDSSIYSVNELVYVHSSSGTNAMCANVVSKPSSTSIVLAAAPKFTDSDAIMGKTYSGLAGFHAGDWTYGNFKYIQVNRSTANSSVNASTIKSANARLIGINSGITADLANVVNFAYNSLTPNFNEFVPANTGSAWYLKGFANDASYTIDSSWYSIDEGIPNEFVDYERSHMSLSSQWEDLAAERAGNNSVTIRVDLATENSKISPALDLAETKVQFTKNIVAANTYVLNGYFLSFDTGSDELSVGDTIQQTTHGNTSYGTVVAANSTWAQVVGINGIFLDDTAFTATGAKSGTVNQATKYSEALGNGPDIWSVSREISKAVILDEGQDAEDIVAYAGAYRPSSTDFAVYAKIMNSADTGKFSTKHWTRLQEGSSFNLFSSKTNADDLVELVYHFPTSVNLFGNTVTTVSSNNIVSMPSTADITNNDIIYIQSDNTAKTFNVREVVYVVNSTAVKVSSNVTFSSTNAMVGIIPGAESVAGAFCYDQNQNIVRYVTETGAVFDTYIQFAFKFVPIANSTAVVPRMADFRAIALQV